MIGTLCVAVLALPQRGQLSEPSKALPLAPAGWPARAEGDWLVDRVASSARACFSNGEVVLANGLARRAWCLAPGVACVALDDLVRGESLLRAIEPEARLVIDGQAVDVGGLSGDVDRAYLRPGTPARMQATPGTTPRGHEAVPIEVRVPWKRSRHASNEPWPPAGQGLVFHHGASEGTALAGLEIDVHYELYDGLPLFAKWLVITNRTPRELRIDALEMERLALVEGEATVEPQERSRRPLLYVESDFAFHGMSSESADVTTQWVADRAYTTQVSYGLHTPCTLVSRLPVGPGVALAPGQSFASPRVFELLLDTDDRERSGLARRRMVRTIAPWVTENPLMMHVRDARTEAVKLALEQCADVGFEMAILSFGSGFDVEDRSPANLERARELVAYAKSKGVELGTYSLLASRSIDESNDVLDRETGKPGKAYFGNSPCLESEWGRAYFEQLRSFYEQSGFSVLEHDGSYPGDTCASTAHPGHRGFEDSLFAQWQRITRFYGWCRERGIYLNVPDWYFLSGSSKTGMGYRETNWSLPRAEQLLHARQNIYDGTWTKTPSMGWMFVPLTEYHGGGPAATLEPLAEHLAEYEQHLAINLGAGVQACWRGPRLYDTEATRELVARWVAWFKKHREVLESDLVHVRRADGRDLDAWLHVNPRGAERGLAMVFNPLGEARTRTLDFPLYYAGLRGKAKVRERDGDAREVTLDAQHRARIEVALPPNGFTWLVFE